LLCSIVVKFFVREIGEIVSYLPYRKKHKLPLLRGSRLKSARASPRYLAEFGYHPNRFTFGGVIAERVKAVY